MLDDELDALFTLPLAEFTGARNALVARLKQDGSGADVARVRALSKPPVSAWAVNQLYWRHRSAFDRLITTGQHFRQVQVSLLAGKTADTRGTIEARRGALSDLSRLAASLLRDAGHNPTPDTMRRIGSTLEAMSVYASMPNAPHPGRLTGDLDPPGFEALSSLVQGPVSPRKAESANAAPEPGKTSHASMATARASLKDAERVLVEVQALARKAEAALKKAEADAKEAERHKREAEDRFRKAIAASEEADQRTRIVAARAGEAEKALEDAKLKVQRASHELKSLLQK